MLYGGIRVVRAQYLYALARICCPPPVVDAMTLADFAVLTESIDIAARGS